MERIKSKVLAWKAKWISLSSHILLIKAVLAAIPNYFIVVLKAPKLVIDQIEKLIKNFLWKGNMNDAKKVPLNSFEGTSFVKSKGGVGLHNMSRHNIAFGGKLIW